jgi:hypothetical protein
MVRAASDGRAATAFHHPISFDRIVKSKNAALPQFLSSQEIFFRIMGFDG